MTDTIAHKEVTKLDANDLMQQQGRGVLSEQLQQEQNVQEQSFTSLIDNDTDSLVIDSVLNKILEHIPVLDFEEMLKEQSSPEEFKKYKGTGDKVKIPYYFKPLAIVQSVLKTTQEHGSSIIIFDDSIEDNKQMTIHVYNGKYFVAVNEKRFKKFLKSAAIKSSLEAEHNYANYSFMQRLYSQFLETCDYVPSYKLSNDRVLLNLNNCTLEFSKHSGVRRLEHSYKYKLKYALDYDYQPDATAHQFIKFLNDILDEESQKLLQDYCGLIFARWVNIQSVPFLYGEGSNGKSVIYEIIRGLLGIHNVIDISLENLARENYLAQIENKLLNYGSDISNKIHKAIFKKLASQEPMDVRKLYKDPYEMTAYGRLMFNTNEFPRILSADRAFYNRVTLINFDTIIPKEQQKQDLHTEILKNESAGVLNWILVGFYRVNSTGKLTHSKKSVALLEQYMNDQDIVIRFLALKGYIVGNTQKMPLQTIFEQYDEYCLQHGYKKDFNIPRSLSKHLKEKFGFRIEKPTKGSITKNIISVLSIKYWDKNPLVNMKHARL
jgi:putative DNA primase/helicase